LARQNDTIVTKRLSVWIPAGRRGGAQLFTAIRTIIRKILGCILGPDIKSTTSGLLEDWLSFAQSMPH
jgi:hypothetical protein